VSICPESIVAKRLIGSRCRLEWWMESVEGWVYQMGSTCP